MRFLPLSLFLLTMATGSKALAGDERCRNAITDENLAYLSNLPTDHDFKSPDNQALRTRYTAAIARAVTDTAYRAELFGSLAAKFNAYSPQLIYQEQARMAFTDRFEEVAPDQAFDLQIEFFTALAQAPMPYPLATVTNLIREVMNTPDYSPSEEAGPGAALRTQLLALAHGLLKDPQTLKNNGPDLLPQLLAWMVPLEFENRTQDIAAFTSAARAYSKYLKYNITPLTNSGWDYYLMMALGQSRSPQTTVVEHIPALERIFGTAFVEPLIPPALRALHLAFRSRQN
jgi:hypothetical protein